MKAMRGRIALLLMSYSKEIPLLPGPTSAFLAFILIRDITHDPTAGFCSAGAI
jgi:hypothetical protein